MMVCFFRFDLIPGHPDERSVHVNILKTGHLGIKTGPEFEKSRDFPVNLDCAAVRNHNTGENLQAA